MVATARSGPEFIPYIPVPVSLLATVGGFRLALLSGLGLLRLDPGRGSAQASGEVYSFETLTIPVAGMDSDIAVTNLSTRVTWGD